MCAPVCVWGEGTKRRVREGGWGDEIGVQLRHQDGSESQPGGRVGGGEEKGRSGRRRTASRPAPGAGGYLQGPERGELRRRPCLGKGTGLLVELVGELGNRRE